MKVRITNNAADLYAARCNKRGSHKSEWEQNLREVEGKWLRVEPPFFFSHQWNTVPIPGVSEDGMRIMSEDVDEISYEGDEALAKICEAMMEGKIKCHHFNSDFEIWVDLYEGKELADELLAQFKASRVDCVVVASVRKPGSIGAFDNREFKLRIPKTANEEQVKAEWFRLFGHDGKHEKWELHHFNTIAAVEETTGSNG
jgi:hypothetical protein